MNLWISARTHSSPKQFSTYVFFKNAHRPPTVSFIALSFANMFNSVGKQLRFYWQQEKVTKKGAVLNLFLSLPCLHSAVFWTSKLTGLGGMVQPVAHYMGPTICSCEGL